MKNPWWLIGLFLIGCSSGASVRTSVGSDEEIALVDVPEHVKAAAVKAVPGLVLKEAEKEIEKGVAIFCLSGTADGKEYEVEVSADGQVLEIESGDDEDDEDAEDDDDDEEGDDDDD